MFVKMANECAKAEGASSTDVDDLCKHIPAAGRPGKCLRACLAENIGMVRQFNMLSLFFFLKQRKSSVDFHFILTEDKRQPCGY